MRILLVAGEPSGDRLGGALMAGLRTLAPGVTFAGVGGPAMAAEGLASLFPMEELSVMGLDEVLPKYPQLRRRMIETAEAVLAARPDALVTIDSPDFGLRVAARVRASEPGIRTIHYVAPSVWAWRPGRAARMARVDWVVVPSLWWEIFCLVLSEAWACGRPVIASDVGGLAERVTDGGDGLLFPLGDARALAEAMRRAANVKTVRFVDALRAVHTQLRVAELPPGNAPE
jgi:glycosyltransferase involved in cell wall biosynthesis